MTDDTLTEKHIRNWLLTYAWMDGVTEQTAEVECIMAQGDWVHIAGRIDRLMAQRSGEHTVDADLLEAQGYALSELYECHTGEHLVTCPRNPKSVPCPDTEDGEHEWYPAGRNNVHLCRHCYAERPGS